MTARDRLVLAGVLALAVLGACWVLLVSPARKTVTKLDGELATASAQLATAQGEVADAHAAETRYSAAYTSIVNLGKAVPPSEEVPSLIYQLAQATNQRHVEFNSITSGASGGSTSTASGAATPSAAPTSFAQMPFTFVFDGNFADLYHLFQQLNKATVRTASGGLQVSGRLLTLQAVKLEPAAETAGAKGSSQKLTGTITATAYVLPATQGLTAGATPSSPASTTAATGATSASGGAAKSSSTPAPAATVEAVR